MRLHKNYGFSLIEIVIAMGVLSLISLGVMNMMKNMSKTSKSSEVSFEVIQVVTSISSVLKDGYSCTATLKGLNPSGNGSEVTEVIRKKLNGEELIVYQSGDVLGAVGSKVFLKKMMIKNFNENSGLGDFVITLNKGSKDYEIMTDKETKISKDKSFGSLVITKSFKLNMLLDSSGDIKSCVSDQDLYTAGACSTLNGDFSDKVKCKSLNISAVRGKPAITSDGDVRVDNGALKLGSMAKLELRDDNKLHISGTEVEISNIEQNTYSAASSEDEKMIATRGWVRKLLDNTIKKELDEPKKDNATDPKLVYKVNALETCAKLGLRFEGDKCIREKVDCKVDLTYYSIPGGFTKQCNLSWDGSSCGPIQKTKCIPLK